MNNIPTMLVEMGGSHMYWTTAQESLTFVISTPIVSGYGDPTITFPCLGGHMARCVSVLRQIEIGLL